ncbi:amidohydrolase [Dehalococcoidia bacterium]|nr:amidohydrolase [Dehalococcoidia bacterium]
MREYKLVSGDGHINEPPELWQERVPDKFKARAPRMERFEQGDGWIFEGVSDPINFGNNINGGRPVEERSPWKRWEEAPAAGYDPAARLVMQDTDGVDAEVVYPTPRPSLAIFTHRADTEFHLACIRAYNDWLGEYCGHCPERLIGAAMMPTLGVESAIAELERISQMPGLDTPLLGMWPSGGPTISAEDDRFWAAVQEMDMPVSIHVSLSDGGTVGDGDPNRTRVGARGELRHTSAPAHCLELINTGVFDRFPKLQVVFAETDSSWVPYVKEQFDDRIIRRPVAARPQIKERPSWYFDHHVYTTYITDLYAVKNRHEIGLTQIMWSSDFPHSGTDYPNSWGTINRHFEGVPEDEKQAILADNAVRVYKMGQQ